MAESVPAAEYQEWPFRGFIKRTRIGKETTLNLEFHLTHLPEDLELSAPFAALRSSIKTSAQRQTSHSAVAHSKTRHVKLRHPTKRIPWTREKDETLVKMKEEDGCSLLKSGWSGIICRVPWSTVLSSSPSGILTQECLHKPVCNTYTIRADLVALNAGLGCGNISHYHP